MNATEQIALLRRACEMARDWYNYNVNGDQFRIRYGTDIPEGGIRSFIIGSIDSTLSATATPPEDALPPHVTDVATFPRAMTEAELVAVTTDVARLTKERDAARQVGDSWMDNAHAMRRERDEARAERDAALRIAPAGCGSLSDAFETLRQERDEALAKLAAAQKELADIYAAKPEPGIVTEDNEGYLWVGCGVYVRELRKVATGVTAADAQRIADALNSGGGK